MKVKELQIGDWVMLDRAYPATSKTPTQVTMQDLIHIEQGKECEPIPLTRELMEKNGFRYERDYGHYYRSILGDYAKDKEPVVCIQWRGEDLMCQWDISDGKGGASYGKHPLALHELQRALRLCGLNDLADNFQI